MTVEKFIQTVAQMRRYQRIWFLFHDKKALKKAIALERQIDESLEVINQALPPDSKQLSIESFLS